MSSEPPQVLVPRDREVRQWAMFLHFSLLAGYVVPLAGLVAPIIIWQVKKADLPELDAHAKIVLNWLISLDLWGGIGDTIDRADWDSAGSGFDRGGRGISDHWRYQSKQRRGMEVSPIDTLFEVKRF